MRGRVQGNSPRARTDGGSPCTQARLLLTRGKAKRARVHARARGGESPTALGTTPPCAPDHDFKLGRHSYTSSHSRTVLSLLLDATIRPSGLKHTEFTQPPCPWSVLTHAPVTASHTRTVLSWLPDASCFPSGLKHTEFT